MLVAMINEEITMKNRRNDGRIKIILVYYLNFTLNRRDWR